MTQGGFRLAELAFFKQIMASGLREGPNWIDISQPIAPDSAVFPGDTPFSYQTMLSVDEQAGFNLTQFTMSPHVGTHADSPLHLAGNLSTHPGWSAAHLPLGHFIGLTVVLDLTKALSPSAPAITAEVITQQLSQWQASHEQFDGYTPQRLLLKTRSTIRYNHFESDYAYLSEDAADWLVDHQVLLVGIDTPSIDDVNSKPLPVHHRFLQTHTQSGEDRGTQPIVWLENLDLSNINTGLYGLLALPLKLSTLEASPVRAVLCELS
jgi:arylformamidase